MKTIATIAAAAVLFAAPAFADNLKRCEAIGNIAKYVMEQRQANVPMQDLLKHARQRAPQGYSFFQTVAVRAYERPRYRTEEYQKNAITDFQNLYFNACMK